MKKIVSIIITVAMLATMFGFNAFAADWPKPDGANDDNTIRFALIADSHLQVTDGASTSQQTTAFERALAAYSNLGVDALVMSGDIIMLANTDTTSEKMSPEYAVLKESLAKYGFSTRVNTTEVSEAGKKPVIYATGNHEFPVGASDTTVCQTALSTFESEMGATQTSDTVIEGVHFITSGGPTYASYASTREAQIKTLVEAAIADTPDKPVFLVLHHPIYETLKSSEDTNNHRYSAEFKAWLNTKSNVIVLSAHTHTAIDESGSIWQDGFTTVSSGYVGGSNEGWSEGYLVEVNDKVATFYKMDFLNGTYIADPWVVDITDLSTYSVAGRANTNAPVFADNAKITVSGIESNQATISWPEATQTATGAYQDSYVEAYTLTVTDAITGDVLLDEYYETYGKQYLPVTSKVVTGLSEYTTYNVKVTAISPFGKVSTPLTTSFTTLDPSLKRDYIVFEVEGNNVFNYQEGWMNEDNNYWHKNDIFSGGVWLQSNISKWTWDFTPEKSGYYRFELSGKYESDKGKTSNLVIGSTTVGTFALGTTTNSDGTFPFVKCGDSIYLTGGTTYKMTLNAMVGGSGATQAYIDCFHIFYDDTRAVTGNSLTTKVGKAGLYGVDVTGYGSAGAKATVTVSETVNGKSNTVTTTEAVALNEADGTSVTTDKVGKFYMDEGEKTVTVNVTGDYTIEKISVYKMLDVKTYGTHIEAEKYATSQTPAFTAAYGDYTNGIFASGLCGENISATYSFTATSDQTYRFDVIGAAEGTTANVAITVNGETINGTVRAGDWQTKENYIGDIDLAAGDYTITLTADNAVTLNAIKVSRGVGNTDILLNAETDYDIEAGHGVGWLDSTPNGYDDNYMIRDTYGYVDVYNSANNVGGGVCYMVDTEWFRYKVDIPRAGYYRVLLGFKTCYATFRVTVNDTQYYDIEPTTTTATQRDWCTNPLPYDNGGLFYFNEGINYVKVEKTQSSGSAQFDALRIVSPDIELYTDIAASSVDLAVSTKTDFAGYDYGTHVVITPGQHIEWSYNAPTDGTYTLMAITNGDKITASTKLTLYVDDVSVGTAVPPDSTGDWNTQVGSFETVLPSVTLKKGENKIKLTGHGTSIAIAKLIVGVPAHVSTVKTVGEGTYTAIVDVTDWYAGVNHNSDTTYSDIMWVEWNSTADEMSELAVIASVYEGNKLVNAYFSNAIAKTQNASNANLNDYKITIEDIVVEDGQTVKLFVIDNGDMTPLADYTIYK